MLLSTGYRIIDALFPCSQSAVLVPYPSHTPVLRTQAQSTHASQHNNGDSFRLNGRYDGGHGQRGDSFAQHIYPSRCRVEVRRIIRDRMFGIDGGVSGRRSPVPLYRHDVGSPGDFLDHTKDEGHGGKDLCRGRIAEG